jgi:putative oxidoreductase
MRTTFFNSLLVRNQTYHDLRICKKCYLRRRRTRFLEGENAKSDVRLNCTALQENINKEVFAALVNRTPPWQRALWLRERRRSVNRLLRLDSGWGIAVVRVIMAFVLIITGYEKLISGIEKVTASMIRNHIPFPTVMAAYITALELIGGVLLLVGLGGRWLGLLYVGEFVVVTFYVQVPTRGWFDSRLPIMMLAGALMLVVAGSGRASLDAVLRHRRHKESR